MEQFVVIDRESSSPLKRGSLSGDSCPDLLLLQNNTTGVIGEVSDSLAAHAQDSYLVVPTNLIYDALAKMSAR